MIRPFASRNIYFNTIFKAKWSPQAFVKLKNNALEMLNY